MKHEHFDNEFTGDPKEAAELERLFKEGCLLLAMNKPKDALAVFRRGLSIRERDARFRSYTGYLTALAEGRVKEGVKLCEGAIGLEFYRPELYLNLGRAYLLAGSRRKANQTFWKGYSLDKNNKELLAEIERMGVRKPPVFPSLNRTNFLNHIIGRILYTLRIR